VNVLLFWAICLVLLAQALTGCAKQATAPPGEKLGAPYSVNGKTYYPLLEVGEYVERGVASWYGKKFHGRTTSSGEVYDMYAPTAAHRILPFGTVVQVTNLTNGRKTVVTINDRGPFVKDRIIDLSQKAALDVGLVGPGTAPVEIEVVGIDDKYAPPKASLDDLTIPWSGSFAVQVAAFSAKANAHRLKDKLSHQYGRVYVVPYDGQEKMLYRVRVGTYESLKETIKVQKKLERHGYTNTFMVAEE
jgi:rare lipoprotein A